MNVAKNWALTIMLTVDNVFPLKSREVGRFFREFWLFSRENPTKSADFSANFDFFPGKIPDIACFSREFWLFFRENPANLADFSANFPLKIPWNFAFFSAKYQKPCSIYFIAGKCPSWAPFWIFWIHTCVNRHQMWDPSFLNCCSYPSCSDNE